MNTRFWGWRASFVAILGGVLAACAADSEVTGTNAQAVSAIAFVQAKSGGHGSTSVTFANPEVAGDLNVLAVGWGDNTTTIAGVTDTRGNMYTVAAPLMTESGTVSPPLRQAIYYAKNIAGGSNTITVTFNGTPTYPDLRAMEYSGADTTLPFDVTARGSGNASGGTVATAGATTTAANELIVGAGMTTDVFGGPGNSFNERLLSPDGNIAEDKSTGAAGSYIASAALTSTAQSWLLQMVTFKPKATGSSPPTIASVSPTSGTTAGGTSVTVTGSNYLSGATVAFCGVAAAKVTFVSASQLTATTPAHTAGACDVKVTDPSGQSATLSGGFTYTLSTATIAWVQTKSGGHGATSATFDSAQTAGNLNVVVIGWGDNTHSVSSVTDTHGNSYAVAAPMLTGTGTVSPPLRQAIYYAKNVAGGTNTVSVQFSGTPTYPDLRILEYAGLDRTAPLDATASGSGNASGGTVATASATTTSSYELVVGGGMTTASEFGGPGSSFTERVLTADGNIAEDRIVDATAAYSASAALSSTSQSWLLQMVTFKAGGTCVPLTHCPAGDNCGTVPDGCGGTINCGTCTPPATCGGAGTPNVCGTGSGHTYSTSFPLIENPISEGGHWVGGQSAGGNLWGNVQTMSGFAFGVSEPTEFGDPTAILTGTWAPDQTAQATVKINAAQTVGCCHEAEVRLRMTISSGSITGYEVYCSVLPGNAYCHIARWNGPNGSYCNIESSATATYLANGDVLKGTVSGTNPVVITGYKNGVQVSQAMDTGGNCSPGGPAGPWTSGNPGVGLFDTDGSFSSFGFSSFTASD